MKNTGLKIILTAMLLAGTAVFSGINAQDPPPPPPPGGGHGSGSNQTGGSAPLGSGIALLLTLGAGYGAKKMYRMRSEQSK